MPTLTRRYTELAVPVSTSPEGIITGTAARYDFKVQRAPRLFEGIRAGAFAAQVKAPNRVMVLWQHDRNEPIGRATSLKDVDGRLDFEARITSSPDVPTARKAMALLADEVIEEVSVGFDWGKWTVEEDEEGTTYWHDRAVLREFSVVTFGAMGEEATVKSVASETDRLLAAQYRARLARLRA
jgi:HK97 family phage prohead protease